MNTELIGIIAGAVSVFAFIPYIYSIVRRETIPNRATWWILASIALVTFVAFEDLGGGHAIWVALSYLVCQTIVAILAIWYGEGGWRKLDIACMLAAVTLGVLWFCFEWSSSIVLFFALAIDFVGLLPTIKKSYLDPKHESLFAWAITAFATVINLFAIESWNLEISMYPIYFATTNILIFLTLLIMGRSKKV